MREGQRSEKCAEQREREREREESEGERERDRGVHVCMWMREKRE